MEGNTATRDSASPRRMTGLEQNQGVCGFRRESVARPLARLHTRERPRTLQSFRLCSLATSSPILVQQSREKLQCRYNFRSSSRTRHCRATFPPIYVHLYNNILTHIHISAFTNTCLHVSIVTSFYIARAFIRTAEERRRAGLIRCRSVPSRNHLRFAHCDARGRNVEQSTRYPRFPRELNSVIPGNRGEKILCLARVSRRI